MILFYDYTVTSNTKLVTCSRCGAVLPARSDVQMAHVKFHQSIPTIGNIRQEILGDRDRSSVIERVKNDVEAVAKTVARLDEKIARVAVSVAVHTHTPERLPDEPTIQPNIVEQLVVALTEWAKRA